MVDLFSSRRVYNLIHTDVNALIDAIRNAKEIDDRFAKILYEAVAVSVVKQLQIRNFSASSDLSAAIHQLTFVVEKNQTLLTKMTVLEDIIDEHIDNMLYGTIEP